MSSLVGEILASKYEILAALGSGASSVVYKVKRLEDGKIFAAKLLHPYLVEKEDSFKRFVQEARATMLLDHEHIIKTHEFDEKAEQPFFIMDFVEGITLAQLIEGGPLSLPRAWKIFIQIAGAMQYAHSKGIVHRSLKPGNIIVKVAGNGQDHALVSDFGLAKLLPFSGQEIQQLTAKGAIMGSPLYMSPEQCMGREADERADIYGFGCLMYNCLTGKAPLKGQSIIETMSKHLSDLPESFEALCPELKIPPYVQAIVFNCLAKRREERYQSMELLLKDLLRFQQGKRPKAMSSSASFRVAQAKTDKDAVDDPDRILKLGLICIFILLIGLVIYAVLTQPQRKNPSEIQLSKDLSRKGKLGARAISPLVLLRQADELRLMNRADEAESIYREAIIRLELGEQTQVEHEALATAHWGLAGILARAGDYEAAEKELRLALYVQELCPPNSAPGKERLRLELAEVLAKQGRAKESGLILNEVAKTTEDTQIQARAFIMLGDLAQLGGKTAEAEAWQLKAIEILKGHGGISRRVYCIVLARYVNLLLSQDKAAEAAKVLRAALAETPVGPDNKFDQASNLFLRAQLIRVLAGGKNFEECRKVLKDEALDLDSEPGTKESRGKASRETALLHDLSLVLDAISGIELKAEDLERLGVYGGGRLSSIATVVRIYLFENKPDKAMNLLLKTKDKALKELASKAEYRTLLALCLAEKGRNDEALEEVDLAIEALRKTYDDQLHLYCLQVKCIILRKLGRADAAELIEKSISKPIAASSVFDELLPPYQREIF